MTAISVLFINCTLKPSPEISETEALWHCVADRYQQKGCGIQQLRLVDLRIFPGLTLAEGRGDEFAQVLAAIEQAEILIVGTPLTGGGRSSLGQQLIERLQGTREAHLHLSTGQPLLYNKVLGLVGVGEAGAGQLGLAQMSYDLGQLGCINPPQNTVVWFGAMDSVAGFREAGGKVSIAVNRQAQLLVDNSLALAQMLRQTPLQTNLWQINQMARSIAQAAAIDPGTLLAPKTLRAVEDVLERAVKEAVEKAGEKTVKKAATAAKPGQNDILSCHHVSKRIWTVMQEGIRRGFQFQVLSLSDKIFRAERQGKGFVYQIYPGHFSFRRRSFRDPYEDYDREQSKSRKLQRLANHGLPIPQSYGTFANPTEIPWAELKFPLVAKPESGSLSRNVFAQVQNRAELQEAAAAIVAQGDAIKLESQIQGRDYRVLIINHQYAGCVERRPANVVGDGEHTLLQLFQLRNQEPERGDRYEAHTTLHQLVFDRTSRQLLEAANYTLDTVLPAGELFYLQQKITASTGSDYGDCTDRLHPSIIQSCIDFSHQFSTLTLGFDLITTDISQSLAETGGAFNEYNFLPYVDLHEFCNLGERRSVCRLIWDYIEAHESQIVTPDFQPW